MIPNTYTINELELVPEDKVIPESYKRGYSHGISKGIKIATGMVNLVKLNHVLEDGKGKLSHDELVKFLEGELEELKKL